MKPGYEALELELTQTKEELAKALELLKKALEEIAKLKERLNLNSKNSSKPPSTDQKGNTDDKEKDGKARTLFPPERMDRHIQCTQENCPHCGSTRIQLGGKSAEVLQQAELPDAKALVTEYYLLKYSCDACGKKSTAPLPTGVFHLAKREAIQLIKELYGVDISVGSVPNIEERVTNAFIIL